MDYLDIIDSWRDNPKLDKELRKELDSLDGISLKDAFYTELKFGTAGLRGLLGVGTNRINIHVVDRVTKGFANYLIKNNRDKEIRVAISYDNRRYSKEFAYEAARVLAANNIKVFIYPNLRPTPMLSFAVRYYKCSGGIMITASHNPKEYNGYKVYDSTGAQTNLEDSNNIIAEIENIKNYFNIEATDDKNLIIEIDDELEKAYLSLVETIGYNKTKGEVKIVYSPLHGTGGTVIVPLLKKHNYNIYPYEPQMINDPEFAATKSSNPEEKITYDPLIDYAKQVNAKAVLVTDPDADRLGVAILHDGEFVLLNGNQTASLELAYILENTKKIPKDGYVFTTIVTSELIKVLATSYKLNVVSTLTGFKFIGEQAKLIEGKHLYVFGCEESYGSLIKDFVRDKDAVQAIYLLTEMINHLAQKGMTLVDYLNQLFAKYGTFYEETTQIALAGISGLEKINNIMEHFRANPLIIDGYTLLYYDDFELGYRYLEKGREKLTLPKSNVVKFYYNNNLTVIFRPSGTEPKLKIYYGVKTGSVDEAKKIVKDIDKSIASIIKEI